jgi:hypothetical protein
VGVGSGGHHDDGHGALPAQGSARLESVHAREHEVDEHQLERVVCESVDRFLAAGHVLDHVALVLQGEAHRRTDPLVVLDDQDAAHRPIMARPFYPR